MLVAAEFRLGRPYDPISPRQRSGRQAGERAERATARQSRPASDRRAVRARAVSPVCGACGGRRPTLAIFAERAVAISSSARSFIQHTAS